MKRLNPDEKEKIWRLRHLEEPLTAAVLAIRFGVCERTIYYVLAKKRRELQGV